ncbi:Serine proteinase stubble [Halotydeus destructor]|nr:Serine proteinase stubble [Halotydeus destructor]
MKVLVLVAVLGLAVHSEATFHKRKHVSIDFGVDDLIGGYGCDNGDCGSGRVDVHKRVTVQRRPAVSTRRTVFSLYGDEECPVTDNECICVPKESCARGYIIEDGSRGIQRRGKRHIGLNIAGSIAGGILGTIGGVLEGAVRTTGHGHGHGYGHSYGHGSGRRGCYENCGGGYGGYGNGFFGVSLGVPTIDINVNKEVHVGGGNGCYGRHCRRRPTYVPDVVEETFIPEVVEEVHVVREVDVGCGPGRDCRRHHPRPRPQRPYRPVIHKEVHVEVPVPGISVNVQKRKTFNTGGDTFVPCTNCGGESKPKEVRPSVVTTRRQKICPNDQVCCRSRSTVSVVQEGSCGGRQACGVDRKTGASSKEGETEFGEYPWQAMILRVDVATGKREFLCNGVLIDNRRVLTVAQCIADYRGYVNEVEVRLGEWDVSSDVEIYPHESYNVNKIDVHPRYENATLAHDLAIVTLNENVKNEAHISPICLPPAKQQFAYGSCVVTGWGNRDPVLKEMPVDCLDSDDCEQRLRNTKLGSQFKLHHSFLCAANKNGATCQIDGGGPLVCKRQDGSYALVGLVSWSTDCTSPFVPEAYCRVQNYLDWIQGTRRVKKVHSQNQESYS